MCLLLGSHSSSYLVLHCLPSPTIPPGLFLSTHLSLISKYFVLLIEYLVYSEFAWRTQPPQPYEVSIIPYMLILHRKQGSER
jgi:hypothetical protein